MKKGLVEISPDLIKDALKFPPDWQFEDIRMIVKYGNIPVIVAVISGSDFPEEENGKIKKCEIICHKEYVRFEVKEKEF